MTFRSKLVAAFSAALTLLICVAALSYLRMLREDEDERWVAYSHRVLERLDAVLADLIDAETGQRGYIITGKDSYLQPYRGALRRVHGDIRKLGEMTADNPTQSRSLRLLNDLVAAKLEDLEQTIALRQREGLPAATAAVQTGTGKQVMDQIRARIAQMRQEEERLLAARLGAAHAGSQKMKAEIVLGFALAFLFLLAAGLVVHHEMAKRQRAENDVLRRSAELEAANKELEAFSYSVSHDLRAPLRAIDGFSQAFLEDYADRLDEQGKEHLERVRAGTQRMGVLIDDLLNLSRITRSELRRQTVDLTELGSAIAGELRRSQPGRETEFVIAPGLRAEADPRLVRVALENLLGNAWKFTAKVPRPRIELGRAETNGSAAFFVRDNGAGFDPAYADRLFGAFQRLHRVTEFPGTGIGLATVQRVVHRHGGKVWGEGAVGQGATFYFTL